MKQKIAREPSGGNAIRRVSFVPFSDIPGQSRLFIDYQRDPAALREFYPNATASISDTISYLPTVLENYRTDRAKLCDALTEINIAAGAGERALSNIDLLRKGETVAVVTGQQAGLFTGPAYTIYKALSAIRMAEHLRDKGTSAVPVFWIASEDHDFDEVAEAWFINGSGESERSTYFPMGHREGEPVGNVLIDDGVVSVLDEVCRILPSTEFSDEMQEALAKEWSPGRSFSGAFAATLADVLGRFGLIIIDPMNVKLKRLAAPIYEQAIRGSERIVTALNRRNVDLHEQGYHAQVLVESDYFPLFWHDDEGRRTSLRRTGTGTYAAKSSGREFSVGELAELAGAYPERFSPGVMLRPVVQDHLLPTACYFGGAAEIAYFAQNSEVYKVLDRPVTPVFHRQSFTIIEPKQSRVFERFGLSFPDLFAGAEQILIRLAENELAPNAARVFAESEERINGELNRLDQLVSTIDVTLAENLAKRRRKIVYHIAALRRKSLLATTRKDETIRRQVEGVFAAVLPGGQLQERSINIFTYVNRFGPGIIDWIYESVDLDDKGHRLIEL